MLLPNRERLKERCADALTSPGFNRLTSMDNGNGDYLSLEAKINDARHQVSVEIQRSRHPRCADEMNDVYEFSVQENGTTYVGKVDLVEENDKILARVHLDKINGNRVFQQPGKKKKKKFLFKSNGGYDTLGKAQIDLVNYWVPTVINHIAKNAGYFLREASGEGSVSGENDQSNTYRALTESQIENASPRGHFREPHQRNIGDYTVTVTGTFVNFDYTAMSTDELCDLVRGHARDISPLHFEKKILRDVSSAGHNRGRVMDAYQSSRQQRPLQAAYKAAASNNRDVA